MGNRMLRALLAGSACALAIAGAAQAQVKKSFSVPAGDLKTALDVYARQSAIQLIYLPADVQGRRSSGVSGALSTEAALNRLLAGSGLTTVRETSGAVMVVRPQAGVASPTPAAPEPDPEVSQVSEVVVTGSRISRSDLTASSPLTVVGQVCRVR